MKKINIHNFWRSDAFIILMFALMSVLSVAIMWYSHFANGTDLSFHFKRIVELRYTILHGKVIPKVSLNTFNQSGSAIMSLYPNLNIYPMTVLSYFIKNFITLFYVIRILRNFLSLIVGYYACKTFLNNKKISLIFTIAFTLSTTTLSLQNAFMAGATSAIIFMPLVLFGFLNLLKNNKWIELTLGVSAITLCHVLDALIIILFLFLFTLVISNNKKMFCNDTLKALSKSIIVTLLITSFFWISFLILILNNKISSPAYPFARINGQSLIILFSAWIPRNMIGLSLASLLGLVLSIFRYKHMSTIDRKLTLISILFMFLSSNLFPWGIFHHTMIEMVLQFPWRLLVIPNIVFSYLFAKLSVSLFDNSQKKLHIFVTTIIMLLLVQIAGQIVFVHKNQNYKRLIHAYDGNYMYIITNNYEFYNLLRGYGKSQYDYYPKQSIKMYETINQHLATYDGNKHIKMKLLGNGGYEFSNKARVKDLSLPFLYYNGINYQVKLDGKTVNGFTNKNSLMTIKNVNRGQHHVRIIVHNTKMQIISYITSLIGLIILLGAIIKKYIKRR